MVIPYNFVLKKLGRQLALFLFIELNFQDDAGIARENFFLVLLIRVKTWKELERNVNPLSQVIETFRKRKAVRLRRAE